MILKGSEAKDIIFEDHDDWEFVEKSILGQRRWVTEKRSIFLHKPTGKFYAFYYDMPSTECSGESDDTLWGDNEDVTVDEFAKVEKTILVWEKVK